jgi:integrase/recombinase XerC/integrase/recombinase XerD
VTASGKVVRLRPAGANDVVTLLEARTRFLARDAFEASTRTTYAGTLDVVLAALGEATPVTGVTPEELERVLAGRWGTATGTAASTFNRHRAAVLSFIGWCADRGWTSPDLPARVADVVEPRKVRRRSEDERRERPLDRVLLEQLWALPGVAGRDRLLWRMAYETWARAEELLGLDVTDLHAGRRQADVHGKGGDVEQVYWSTGTARLLPRVVADRTSGPLFLASRLPTRAMPAGDVDPSTGRARLSYRRAAALFAEAGQRLDPDGAPWTLHRLRHAGIAHAVEDGWNLAQVRAKSRHASLRSLEVYANPSAAAVRAMTDQLDPESRGHPRRWRF